MTDLIVVVPQPNEWHRLKALVLDSVSSPITRRVYSLGLDEFIAWYGLEARPGFTKAAVNAWRITLEARGLGSVSINVRITAVRKLAVEAADNGFAGAGTGRRVARPPVQAIVRDVETALQKPLRPLRTTAGVDHLAVRIEPLDPHFAHQFVPEALRLLAREAQKCFQLAEPRSEER